MVNPEQVIIDVKANDYASAILSKLEKSLSALQNIGKNISIPNINSGNQVTSIAYDFNKVQNEINNAQKALNEFNNSSSKSSSSSSLSEAYKQLEKIRTIAQGNIKVNIDEGNLKHTSEQAHKTQLMLEKIKENASKSFAGNSSVYVPNYQMIGQSYFPSSFAPPISESFQLPTNVPLQLPTNTPLRISSNTPLQLPTNVPLQVSSNVPLQLPTNVPLQLPQYVNNGFQLQGKPYDTSGNFQLLSNAKTQTSEAPFSKGELIPTPNFSIIKNGYDDAVKSANNFGKQSQDAVKSSYSSFHQLNNMMVVVGGTFNDLGTKIAGIFGAAGLSGMVQKMWEGASQRQQNMMYLMHRKGKEQATTYYNEIMDIVTQLPGDDTFLTNILNMASAMDGSLKLENLEGAGRAITDYYMSATMKGENSYETQRDLRKYITTGDTRGMRNSVIASEIDLLKNRNSVLERTQALEQALKNTGFDGMSGYESASNQLEELKGHFQKAFADLGEMILAVVQPLMKFYNTMDTIFGGRLSQLVIIMATALVGLFTTIGGGLILLSSTFRIIETITLGMEALSFALSINVEERGLYNTLLMMSMSLEEREKYLKGEITLATWDETVANIKNTIARKLGVEVTGEEIVTNRALVGAIYGKIRAKVGDIVATANGIYVHISDVFWKLKSGEASLSETVSEEINTLSKKSNTFARLRNVIVKLREFVNTLIVVGAIIIATAIEWTNTESVFANTYAHVEDTSAKILETEATLGLASATAILDVLMSPLTLTILAIVGAILILVTVIEKVGEAFGWWKDFGSMISAIGDGINRLWNAFVGSDVIQGIIQYFTDFVSVLQYVWDSVSNLFGAIFGWNDDNTGTFDIVQSIINVFGTLGEIIKWVWNLMDDWSNSPLGIITWLNPLGILIFHLDEIGSLFEDIGDAINRFTQTTEFNELMEAFGEVWNEIQEPFQEIWSLINEIIGLFGELFGSDPVGQGTEERINFLVEILRGVAVIIRVVVIPAIRGIALAIRIVLTPLRVVLTVIRAIVGAIQWATGVVDIFGVAWQVLTAPITLVQKILQGIGDVVNMVSNAIKNSIIGKLLGWDKDNKDESGKSQVEGSRKSLYGQMKNKVKSSDMDFVTKNKVLGELDKQNLTASNVNNVRNLGRTYNNHNNQRQVVINQNFSEGSMPIDARNMTKKEAKKMFVGAFGYNRAVGRKGILR